MSLDYRGQYHELASAQKETILAREMPTSHRTLSDCKTTGASMPGVTCTNMHTIETVAYAPSHASDRRKMRAV